METNTSRMEDAFLRNIVNKNERDMQYSVSHPGQSFRLNITIET